MTLRRRCSLHIFALLLLTNKFRIRALKVCGCLLYDVKAVDLSRLTPRFEVLTAVFMETSVFWDLTPFVFLYKYGRFGGACSLRLQGSTRTGMYCVISYKTEIFKG
jgi:hypothetical protein